MLLNKSKKLLKRYDKIATEIEKLDDEYSKLSDKELKEKTNEFKERLKNGETLDNILVEAFATVRETSWRVLKMKHFHVQLIGGIVLHNGNIAEMKTGEGKTLVATLPSYLNALTGEGVHVITVNDYLAKRDMLQMGKVHRFLGLSVDCVVSKMDLEERKKAYAADITYGTNKEFGFDYLRDNMATSIVNTVQRGHNFVILDEVDSILIDEARTPLIISSQGGIATNIYKTVDTFVRTLKRGITPKEKTKMDEIMTRMESNENDEDVKKLKDYIVDEKHREAYLTDSGIKKVEKYFNINDFGSAENIGLQHMILQSIKAHILMKKDVSYVIENGEAVIVDEFTGRKMEGRRFNDGLHQAIEAKEGIEIKEESNTHATITLQNYFRMYHKLSGMTGTAKTEEQEFKDIYNIRVIEIPTNKPVIRKDLDDVVYTTSRGKFNAVFNHAMEIHKTGQPVLIGTASIDKSEMLSELFKKAKVKHEVLNAKQNEREAEIVSQAGRLNQITIATNMAGRGTDILLGGNPEFMAVEKMKKLGYTEDKIDFATSFEDSENDELLQARDKYNELLRDIKVETDKEHKEVVELGGLYIIGTEKHESRRIDNQLRGRAGRQGDPGTSKFFLSLDDDMLKQFGGEMVQKLGSMMKYPENEPIMNRSIAKTVARSQRQLEARNFESRKNTLEYDDVNNAQRDSIYSLRREVLEGRDLNEQINDMMKEVAEDIVNEYIASKTISNEELNSLHLYLQELFYQIPYNLDTSSCDAIVNSIYNKMQDILKSKEKELLSYNPDANIKEMENYFLLMAIDKNYVNYISALEALRESVSMNGYGANKPIEEYQSQAFSLFDTLLTEIKKDTIYSYMRIRITPPKKQNILFDVKIYLDNEEAKKTSKNVVL